MAQKPTSRFYLDQIKKGFVNMKEILITRFNDERSTLVTEHSIIRNSIYDLTKNAKPTTKDKVQINKYIRDNIQAFIKEYVKTKIEPLDKLSKNPHTFVSTLNQLWIKYQTFVFAHYFVTEKVSQFFISFHKMNNAKDYEYPGEISKKNEQVAAVAVIGINQLKKYFDEIKLIDKFKTIFNQFLLFEREGKNVPRSEIRESIHSLESCYFDMDAFVDMIDGMPKIIKKQLKSDKMPQFRKSKDGIFFKEHLLAQTVDNLARFYDNFVQFKAVTMSSTDQIKKMIEIINQEQARAIYYIHSADNRKVYLNCLNAHLINYKVEARIRKQDGLRKYIELYQEGGEEYEKEIKDFWFIYSRVLQNSLKIIKEIFKNYLQSEAEKLADKTKKPLQFITDLIKLNGKCIKIVNFCDVNFDLENDRNTMIRGIMSNDITEKGKKELKTDFGAKNLAIFINQKFKSSYSKGGTQALGQSYGQMVNLFKILEQKTRFIDEEQKLMANRLLEDIQFSKDLETGQIISMEKNFIEEMQIQCGVSDVKQLAQNIKDIEKSNDLNNQLKTKLSGDKIFPLNQIIIKNSLFWPERPTYKIENPPNLLIKSFNAVSEYFRNKNTNIQFEFNSGISLFKGEFDNGKRQSFQLKNIYLLILLFIEQEGKVLYGNIKKKIEAVGSNKQKGIIELVRVMIQLLYSGLLKSSKVMKPGTPNICKILDTDDFQINRKYDFLEEEKKKKASKGPPPKAVPILKATILQLSQQLKRGIDQQMKAINDDEINIEKERKFKIQAITVKSLKHAHHHHMNCTFEQLYKVTQEGRNKQFRATEKFLKEIIEELINKKFCQRIQGQRNVFRYIA